MLKKLILIVGVAGILTTPPIMYNLTSVIAQENVNITIFVDEDTLVVFVPGNQLVSLEGLGFEVAIGNARKTLYLDQYISFQTIRFDAVRAPVCFRLARDGTRRALPLDCDPNRTLTHYLANADVFWFDSVSNQTRTLLVVDGVNPLDFCAAGQSQCFIVYTSPSSTPVSTPISDPTSELSYTQTPEAAATKETNLLEQALGRARSFSGRNDDWEPFIQEFDGFEMVLVPIGCFTIGSEDGDYEEQNGNKICFDEPFWIDRYEVTNEQYGSIGCEEYSSEPTQPRNCINWFDARDFCEARGARLPTEAEWEYAAGGPDELIYPWGNEFIADNVIHKNTPGFGGFGPAPVGSRPDGQSWVGALDMSGNLGEWTNSLLWEYPYNEMDGREENSTSDNRRVWRGGAFVDDGRFFRTTNRYQGNQEGTDSYGGFRCASSVED